jgi:hypothetical protein
MKATANRGRYVKQHKEAITGTPQRIIRRQLHSQISNIARKHRFRWPTCKLSCKKIT